MADEFRQAGAGILSLDSLGLKHKTDKASVLHNFLHFYERFLAPMRLAPITLLEVGVYNGGSVKMWEEYFPYARIIGVDINPEVRQYASERITIEIADQGNVDDLSRLKRQYGPFDVVLDDGSHYWWHQILTMQMLFPAVKPGGIYVLEDIDTSYGNNATIYSGGAPVSAAKYLQSLADYLVADVQLNLAAESDAFVRDYVPQIESIAFSRRTSATRRRQ